MTSTTSPESVTAYSRYTADEPTTSEVRLWRSVPVLLRKGGAIATWTVGARDG